MTAASARPAVWRLGRTAAPSGAALAEAFGVQLRSMRPSEAMAADTAPPRALVIGALDAAEVALAARAIDAWRERGHVALVIDGHTLAGDHGESSWPAAREHLLPRADVLTLQSRSGSGAASLPALAREWRRSGVRAVAIDDTAEHEGRALSWIDTPQASGWLALPSGEAGMARDPAAFAFATAAACARGFITADALVLATMACATRSGPATGGFVNEPARLPLLSFGETPRFASPAPGTPSRPLGLYAIVDRAERVRQVLAAGVHTVQLRIKTEATAAVREAVRQAIADGRSAGAELFVNDHWDLAIELGASGVHLGQEDLLALDDAQRAAFAERGIALGISSHSLWELCRARSLAPRYIACGPVWPTLTKAMPWRPQGLDNLAWWCAMAGAPVVAIGGILSAPQFADAAAQGADGVCAVRVLGDDPAITVPALQQALQQGARARSRVTPDWPHPSLEPN